VGQCSSSQTIFSTRKQKTAYLIFDMTIGSFFVFFCYQTFSLKTADQTNILIPPLNNKKIINGRSLI